MSEPPAVFWPAGRWHGTEEGPLVNEIERSGDGIIGGESAGYWVRLLSDGSLSVFRLNPRAVLAFTPDRGIRFFPVSFA